MMKIFSVTTWLIAGLIAAGPTTSILGSEQSRRSRGVLVDEVRNEHSSFLVRVDVDQADRRYVGGEEMRVSVVSAKAGYLYLLYCDAAGNVASLFPNAFDEDNRVQAMRPVTVPRPPRRGRSSFRLRIGPPYGKELLKAIVSIEPLKAESLNRLMRRAGSGRPTGARGPYVEEDAAVADWAEHHVEIVTRAPGGSSHALAAGDSQRAESQRKARRVGVFIGISKYRDERVRPLSASENDARAMADVMRRRGEIGQGWVLLNEQATRTNIQRVLRQTVAGATRPGDSVLIYWSGHGARCADAEGDERDGFDEYLVPHDGRLDNLDTIRQSMILDDMFGRWIQELDGRRVVVVLDTCHSGGQSSQAKSIRSAASEQSPQPFNFLGDELKRIKDIGQRDTALLASSTASQLSFRRDESDLSTMTHFLVQHVQDGSRPLALDHLMEPLKRDVDAYVQRKFPGAVQTPVLIDNLTGPYYLRP